jgi:hypothetical protein
MFDPSTPGGTEEEMRRRSPDYDAAMKKWQDDLFTMLKTGNDVERNALIDNRPKFNDFPRSSGGKKRSCKKRGGKKRSCKKRGGKKRSCKKRGGKKRSCKK